MRIIYSLVIIFFISISNISAQNLTMAQLLNIRKMDLGSATEYLNTKGWEFVEAEDETENTLGSITFAYGKSNMNDNANSWLFYYFSEVYDTQRLTIQVNAKNKYNEYLAAIKGYGCKLINSRVENGSIIQTYRGATTTFIIHSSTAKNFYNIDSSMWLITLRSNDDV